MGKIITLLIVLIIIRFIWFNRDNFGCDELAPVQCNQSEECQWVRRECRNIGSGSCDPSVATIQNFGNCTKNSDCTPPKKCCDGICSWQLC
jgi:hypothetical protein